MKKETKQKAIQLFKSGGYTQKEIAQKLGISEKTAGIWLKPYKKDFELIRKTKTNLIKRINEELKNNAPANVIKDLADSLTLLKRL